MRCLFPDVRGVALVAVGGYGRAEVTPGSDLDLLVLHHEGLEVEAQEAAAAVLYPLWDARVRLGHAIRTPEECRVAPGEDLHSLTALLDARRLAGDAAPIREALAAAAGAIGTDLPAFLDALRASRVEREARHGLVGESLEPDVKESLGGLRDAQLLRWVAHAFARPGTGGDGLLEAGLASEADLTSAAEATDRLLLVRIALHRVAGGASNRLAAEHQAAVAEVLGVPGEPGWEPRDALMRSVFAAGRRIHLAAAACLERGSARAGGRVLHVVGVDRLRPVAEALLEATARVAEEGGWIDPEDLEGLDLGTLRVDGWTEAMREAFVRALASGEGGVRALSDLDTLGGLVPLVPEWEAVRARPQRDPYHRFPVDTHLLRAAGHMARLLFRPDEPFAARAVAALPDAAVALLGAFLHDIGKRGTGSHVPAGVEAAAAVLDRMGVPAAVREEVLFLVREHLLLANTATRRDLEDQDLILHVAARIRDPGRLAALYLLTLADAASTGPAAGTPWRLGLVRDLVAKVGRAFERGDMDRDRAARLEAAEAAIRSALAGRRREDVDAFLDGLPPAYLLWATAEDAAVHFDLVVPRPGATEARTYHRPGRSSGVHLLSVAASDRPGLLARVAGALTLAGLSVLSAQAFTTEQGVALDVFEIVGAFEDEVGEDRWRRFRRLLRHALEGRIDVADRIRELRAHYRTGPTEVPVRVKVLPEASDYFTVVEVGAPDRLGLLFDLARVFADLRLDVHLAKVATYGSRVVDVFYVTGGGGEKLDGVQTESLAAALRRALE